jgi:molybdopterin/thiamine biosynthesis adenylyltransferase
MYLAAAGVGHITVLDDDTVDLTNLQRQIAHRTDTVGIAKVQSLSQTLHALNPHVKVTALKLRADETSLAQLVAKADVVLDCCDNFTTRQAVNKACVLNRKPLVSGAAIQFDGQVSVYDARQDAAPCYACTFSPDATFEEVRCSTMGVFAPLVGIIGSIQAAEALKLLSGAGEPLTGRLLMLDGRRMEWTEIRMPRNPACPVCSR